MSTTLLGLLSCVGNKIIRYIAFSLLVAYSGFLLARSLLPSARLIKLESLVAETIDILERANEERMLFNREFKLEMQLRLSRVNLTKSTLRSKLLEFGLGCPTKEYLHIMGALSAEIERCKREVKEIQIAILTEMENERRVLYNANIDDMVVVLSSGCSRNQRAQRQ